MGRAPTPCAKHTSAPAGWRCQSCGRDLCVGCASSRKAGTGLVTVCRHCGGFAPPILVPRASETFAALLPEALVYPFSRNGLLTMLAMGAALTLLAYLPFAGPFLAAGALWSYLFAVIRSSAAGHPDVPQSEDFGSVSELFGAALKAFVALALSLAPALAYFFLGKGAAPAEPLEIARWLLLDPVLWLMLALGLAWVPVALVMAATHTPLGTMLNPAAALRTARLAGTDTALLALAFWALVLFGGALDLTASVFNGLVPLPFVPGAIGEAVATYPALAFARVLGSFVFVHGARLGYGSESDHYVPAVASVPSLEEALAPSSKPPPARAVEVSPALEASLKASGPVAEDDDAILYATGALPDPPDETPPTFDALPAGPALPDLPPVVDLELLVETYRLQRGDVPDLAFETLAGIAELAASKGDLQTSMHARRRAGLEHPTHPAAPGSLLESARLLGEKMGRGAEGLALLDQLVRAHPGSPAATEAAAILARIRGSAR